MANILVIDDELSVQDVLKTFLEIDGHNVSVANSYDEAISELSEKKADLVVTDVILGRKTGLEVLDAVKSKSPDTPVIVITGQPSIETATNCVRAGAFDFLHKPLDQRDFIDATRRAIKESRRRKKHWELKAENRKVRHLLGERVEKQSIEIERATKALIRSEHRYRSLVGAVPEIILEFDLKDACVWYNEVGYKFFGDKIYNRSLLSLCTTTVECGHLQQRLSQRNGNADSLLQVKTTCLRKDGAERFISWTFKSLLKPSGEIYGTIATGRDITEMAKLEEQLRQKAKLETIGQLAGGVAHDFNNMLGAILAQANLIKKISIPNDKLLQSVSTIESAVLRAKELTDKLLGFAQCGKARNCTFSAHSIIEEVVTLLKRTLDKRITITTSLNAIRDVVEGDPNQFYQVILNLAVNSRDAIMTKFQSAPGPNLAGSINISTEIADNSHFGRGSADGSYLKISASDNGCGIKKEIEKRIFEPFFSTKKESGNSGMGLAMVFGIVANHSGFIIVTSKENEGTTLEVFLPVSKSPLRESQSEHPISIDPQHGTILLIDDEELVRTSVSTLLRSLGYQTFCAGSGSEALAVYEPIIQNIDLVIIDFMMPGIDIQSCLRRLKGAKPSLKIILTSGYGLKEESQELLRDLADGFIQKPFKSNELSRLTRELLFKH